MPSDPKKFLVEHGWTPEVAGADFDKACRALVAVSKSPKGLIVSGKYGCGKTSFVKAAFRGYRFWALPMDEELAFGDNPDWVDDNLSGNVIIDDVGCEHLISEYGTKKEAFADYICLRHLRKGTGKLVITTNLSERQMDARYGGRVVSRLKDLCLCVKFTGEDKRKWEIIQ